MGTFEEEEIGLLVEHSSPLEPIPPELPASLLPGVGAVLPRKPAAILFDVYGTLFISGSGEIGTVSEASNQESFLDAYRIASGIRPPSETGLFMRNAYYDAISRSHEQSRVRGEMHPEVDIVSIWRTVVNGLHGASLAPAPVDVEQLAMAFETVVNPVWPMPGALELLRYLRSRDVPMGIVSNAQFYTPMLFPAFFGSPLEELGFVRDLLAFSYEHGRAKPDATLFAPPLALLRDRGIDSCDVVYVGNDMRNDVWCARQAGCMTVLFAGDARSLRPRIDDPEIRARPDSIISSLDELPGVCRIE